MRIGIDVGGSKIEVAALDGAGGIRLRRRVPTPADYEEAIAVLVRLVQAAEAELGQVATVGIGFPGRVNPVTGLVKNGNCLNGRRFQQDAAAALGRDVRVANDANCFTLSEAVDGAGRGARTVFGVILGTGCGGGITVDGRLLAGRHDAVGEWGHNSLAWPLPEEVPGLPCWCGQSGCQGTLLSGNGLARDCDGPGAKDASSLPGRAACGEARAREALGRYVDRLARALSHVVNLLDPDIIVLGGGVSQMAHLYKQVPPLTARHVFAEAFSTPIVRNVHGDSSGVRGAAWLWPQYAAVAAGG